MPEYRVRGERLCHGMDTCRNFFFFMARSLSSAEKIFQMDFLVDFQGKMYSPEKIFLLLLPQILRIDIKFTTGMLLKGESNISSLVEIKIRINASIIKISGWQAW